MHLFIESGRGGIRYGKANNIYMGKHYNPNLETSFLIQYDVCMDMYGLGMAEPFPFRHYEWVDRYSVDIQKLNDEYKFGYIFEVDLEYSKDVFGTHKDLPFCPEHMVPPTSLLK